MKKNYNGQYEMRMSVIVTTNNHMLCLDILKTFKKLCGAWFFTIKDLSEYKSARKGDVLQRELQIAQIAYAPDIIVFKESIYRIADHFNGLGNFVIIKEHSTIPKDSRVNLINQVAHLLPD